MRRASLPAIAFALLAARLAAADSRPNFLVIVTDDQRADTFNTRFPPDPDPFMPAMDTLFRDGVRFERGYVTTPLCAPSRASIFTGKYAHAHGVETNKIALSSTNFPTSAKLAPQLQTAGYYTALVGKYMNQWSGPVPNGNFHPPGYDFWTAIPGGGVSDYYDYDAYISGDGLGARGVHEGPNGKYITYFFRDQAKTFLQQAATRDQPFLLFFTPNAPHAPAMPAPEDADLFTAARPPVLDANRPPSFNEPAADKPAWVRDKAPLTPAEIATNVDAFRLNQLRCLAAVDRSVQELIDLLASLHQPVTGGTLLSNTVVFFIGDNGYYWGEHKLTGKNHVYEEAVRVPFAVRDFRQPGPGRVDSFHLVANIDIAPTVYQMAGVTNPPAGMNGRSLVPLLANPSIGWRLDLEIESWPPPDGIDADWDGIVAHKVDGCGTPQPKYVTYAETETVVNASTQQTIVEPEFYDLELDAFEMVNAARSTDPNVQKTVQAYSKQFHTGPH
jgi:N-acetylglucosamine-6-sulfatase